MRALTDTIVAISTPIGVSAISIVRLCGDDSLNIAKRLLKVSTLKPRYAYLKYIYDSNSNVIDRGIVIYFRAPNSFNGEDIIEFQIHGGILVSKAIVNECLNYGARLANAGEFSKIAMLNGKLNLAEIENIAKLISAQSLQALQIIARNLKGDLANFINDLRLNLLEILSSIEALIDYAEEDLPSSLEETIQKKLLLAIDKLDSIYQHSLSLQNVIDGHKLAIIGKPNVGKSSILNKLLLKDRAIVSDIAGTTRDIIEDSITINNQIIKIIDTAGIRNTNEQIEKIGIEKSLEALNESSIILAVFDGSRDFDDDEIVDLLLQNRDKIIIVAINKSDKLQILNTDKLSDFECVSVSILDNSVFKIRDIIAEKITINALNNESIVLSTKRQLECIESCIGALKEAKDKLSDFEIFGFHINEALRALDLLSKPFSNEEMLDKMFSTFCLGK